MLSLFSHYILLFIQPILSQYVEILLSKSQIVLSMIENDLERLNAIDTLCANM